MPDYDIEVTGLATPPVAAPVASYRPAVSVRNNGIHPANVSGTMRVYRREPPGELLGTFTLSLANLAAGATGTAQSSTFWTPAVGDIGREFLFTADVTSDDDQVEPNNHLGPTTVLIIPGEEPTPPAVIPHAPQHEDGGSDEINIAGLPGQAADPQVPTDHESTHRAGAPDELNVANLRGVLFDDQRAQDHGNERHTPDMASSAELDAHALGTTAHADASNLANREVSGDEEGLVKGDQLVLGSVVPASLYNALRADRYFGPAKHAALGANAGPFTIIPTVGPVNVISLDIPAEWLTNDLQVLIDIGTIIHRAAGAFGILDFLLMIDNTFLSGLSIDLNNADDIDAFLHATVIGAPSSKIIGGQLLYGTILSNPTAPIVNAEPSQVLASRPEGPSTLRLDAEFTGDGTSRSLTICSALMRTLSPIP